MGYYSDPNKRADYYYDKSQKFFLDYGGENLRMFCTLERVSYVKILEAQGWTSVPSVTGIVSPSTSVDSTSRAESIKIRQFLLKTSALLGRLSANCPKVTAY